MKTFPMMSQSVFSLGCFSLFLFFVFSQTGYALENFKEKESDKPTVLAVQNCLAHLQGMIDHPATKGSDLKCQIPVDVDEEELNTILKQAFEIKKLKSYKESFANFSSKMTKSLINARSAVCVMNIQMARDKVLEVVLNNDGEMSFEDQPLSCEVKTKSNKIEKVSFSFKPKFTIKKRCITAFKPNMGNIKAPCKMCRLFVTTKLVSLWVNHIGKNITPVFNQILYRKCS